MKKNKTQLPASQLLQKLSMLSSAFLAGTAAVNAQIVYVNFDPDVVLDPEANSNITKTYDLDILEDGIKDFTIINKSNFYGTSSGSFSTSGTAKGAFVLPDELQAFAGTGTNGYIMPLGYGHAIGNSLSWIENPAGPFGVAGLLAYHAHDETEFRGVWEDKEGKFMGIRLKKDDTTYYGWVRMSLSENTDVLYIHDYAYEESPETGITAGATGLDCNAAFPLFPVLLSPSQVRLKWQTPEGVNKYKLRYKAVEDTDWTNVTIAGNKTSKIISGLNCNTEYEWQIRALCEEMMVSVFSEVKTFKTGDCKLNNNNKTAEVKVFPNPASDILYIDADIFTGNFHMEIINSQGQTVISKMGTANSDISIDVSQLPPGIYFIHYSDGQNNFTEKVILF